MLNALVNQAKRIGSLIIFLSALNTINVLHADSAQDPSVVMYVRSDRNQTFKIHNVHEKDTYTVTAYSGIYIVVLMRCRNCQFLGKLSSNGRLPQIDPLILTIETGSGETIFLEEPRTTQLDDRGALELAFAVPDDFNGRYDVRSFSASFSGEYETCGIDVDGITLIMHRDNYSGLENLFED